MQEDFHKDKLRIFIFNILLTLLSLILLIGVFAKENGYKKNERFDFSSNVILSDSLTGLWLYQSNIISNAEELDIVNRENWRKIFINGNSSYEYTYSDSEENTIIPDSISFSWFSYSEEKFYNLKDNIPNKRIIEWLKRNELEKIEFNFVFNSDGKVEIYLNDYFNKSKRIYIKKTYKANVIKNQPWNDRTNREEDVALINYNKFIPFYIHIKNQNKLRYIKLESELKLKTLRNYFSVPNRNGKMNNHSGKEKGFPESVRIEIKDSINDKSKSFFIDFDIEKSAIKKIIKQFPKSEFEFHIKMNDLDSIQEIYIKDSKQIIPLRRPRINYRLQEYLIE